MGSEFTTLSHRGIQVLSPYIPGKSIEEVRKETGISNIIKLASNENPFGCSPKVIEVLQNSDPIQIARYPAEAHHPLRQQLSDFLQVPTNMLSLANGSDSLFGVLLTGFALLVDKHMITHDYAFNTYAIQSHTLGVEVVTLAMKNWTIDVDAVIAACTAKTALIFIDNPSNPVGSVLPLADIEKILLNIPKTTLLVLDEAYYEFLPPNSMHSIPLLKKYRNLIITRTFSKAYGLAGLRLGYAIADPEITEVIQKVHLPFTANILALNAASAALSDQAFVQHTQQHVARERQAMMELLDAKKIHYLPPNSNFITIECGQDRAVSMAQEFQERGIIIRPLHPYGMNSYIRVSIGTTEQNQRFIREFFDILQIT